MPEHDLLVTEAARLPARPNKARLQGEAEFEFSRAIDAVNSLSRFGVPEEERAALQRELDHLRDVCQSVIEAAGVVAWENEENSLIFTDVANGLSRIPRAGSEPEDTRDVLTTALGDLLLKSADAHCAL